MNYLSFIKSTRFLIALIIFIGLFFIKYNPVIIGIILFCIAAIYNTKTIRPLRNYKFWIVIAILIIAVPLFTGTADRTILGIDYSSGQLEKTLSMTLRGISVFLLFQVLTVNMSIEKIKPLFNKIGFRNFDILYNLSNEIFPKIKSILLARYGLFKEHWKSSKTANTLLNFSVDIFTDFFDLIKQLGADDSGTPMSPKDLLADINGYNKLIMISGDAGSGKTTWVEEFIQLAKISEVELDGLYSKKIIEPNGQWHHNLIRVSTNDEHRLNSMEPFATKVKVGKFFFYEESIAWGNDQIKASREKAHWIIIDEIGLLEFDGGGFLPGLKQIATHNDVNLIITIRASLLQHLDEFIADKIPSLGLFNKRIVKLQN